MRFLLTRPLHDSEMVASLLHEKNITTHIDPLMFVEYLPVTKIDVSNFQAVIFTSSNGVRAFEQGNYSQNLISYVVGQKTAESAYHIGLKHINNANGDVEKLSKKIISELNPAKGPLLYLCGIHIAGTLVDDLNRAGFNVKRQNIYQTVAAKTLDNETKTLLKTTSINYIPFYSPRSALIFNELINKADLQNTLATVTALCLSPNIAEKLSSLNRKKIMIAPRSTQNDLFKMIDIEL